LAQLLLLVIYRIHPVPHGGVSQRRKLLASYRILRVDPGRRWVCSDFSVVIRIPPPSIDRYKYARARNPASNCYVYYGSERFSYFNTRCVLQSAPRSILLAVQFCGAVVGSATMERERSQLNLKHKSWSEILQCTILYRIARRRVA
jgi:hypothetical protein